MVIGQSICHTIAQIELIQKRNLELELINCYYILFSRKRAPNFGKWVESIDKKIKSAELSTNDRRILMGKDKILGGYFCVDGELRNNCLGQTFSTFICRQNDSQNEISQTLHHIQTGSSDNFKLT